jgi:hypothetical protein
MKIRIFSFMILFVALNMNFVFSQDADIPKNNTPVFVVAETGWFYVNDGDIGKDPKEIKGKDWKQLFFGNKVIVVNNKKVKDAVYLCVQLPDKSKCWGRIDYFTQKFIVITKKDLVCYTQPDDSYTAKFKLQPGYLGYYIKEESGFIYASFQFYRPKKAGDKSLYINKVWIKSMEGIYTDDIDTAAQADYLTTAYNYLYSDKTPNVSAALSALKKGLELNDGEETQVTDILRQLNDELSGGQSSSTSTTDQKAATTTTETNVGNYYMPNVDSLRLRESATVDGKVIRTLQKGEKLKLIEKGSADTVNGVKGAWGKYETAKGETGWCFDAYLTDFN